MGQMKRAQVIIAGNTALIMDREIPGSVPVPGMSATFKFTTETPREQCEAKIYYSQFGLGEKTVVIPVDNLMRCIMEGGKKLKIGKAQITTAKTSILSGLWSWHEEEFELKHSGWEVLCKSTVNPSTGGRNGCNRPIFYEWSLEFYFDFDANELHPNVWRDIIVLAGRFAGLGNYRKGRKGRYGEFAVTKWLVTDIDSDMPELSQETLALSKSFRAPSGRRASKDAKALEQVADKVARMPHVTPRAHRKASSNNKKGGQPGLSKFREPVHE